MQIITYNKSATTNAQDNKAMCKMNSLRRTTHVSY